MTNNKENYILAGDIGGTKTVLGLFPTSPLPCSALHQQKFPNAEFKSLDELLGNFLTETEIIPVSACFGIAGPVVDNQAQMTNLNWFIDGRQLKKKFGFSQVTLINDLVATALGAVILPKKDLLRLNRGHPAPNGNIAVIAPGTGLGEAFILRNDNHFLPQATEGGHVSFAPRNAIGIELLQFLLARQSHVSVEQVCSGLALPVLYDFLTSHYPPPAWLTEQMLAAKDKTPVIVKNAVAAIKGKQECDIAVETLRLFVDILADETANLALKTLATGGIYIGGGICPRILDFLDPSNFIKIFARGVYKKMLAEIPIHVILNPDTALLGAAVRGSDFP
jgi:glucokinase